MQKPENYPIESEAWLDYGLTEHVARHLQSSPLHVYGASVISAVPAPVGDPNDPLTSIMVDFTLVSDGRSGWLVLVSPQVEWDAEVEMSELVEGLLEMGKVKDPPKSVVRAANRYDRATPGALDLRDPNTVRARLEAEFERHFEGVAASSVEDFLQPFETFHYALRDELAIRREMNQDE